MMHVFPLFVLVLGAQASLQHRSSVSPLLRLHAAKVAAAAPSTTAVSVWPAEAGAVAGPTTPAPPLAAAAAAAAPPAPRANNVSGVAPQAARGRDGGNPCMTTTGEAAPLIAAAAPAGAAATAAGDAPAPCSSMNTSATVHQLQNAAQLSAQAAQAALEAVSRAGRTPSNVAVAAHATSSEGAAIWERLFHTAVRTETDTLTAAGQLKAMKKLQQQAAGDYERAVVRVRDFPPNIPAVQAETMLRGITRT